MRERLGEAGIRVVQTPYQAPNANAYAEPFVRSIKEECLDRLIPIGERHFRRAVTEYVAHYHRERSHQGVRPFWTISAAKIRDTSEPGRRHPMRKEVTPEKVVQEIRRKTRRQFSAEEKIRIVLEGLRGEESIATLCRKEGLAPNLYYRWSKEFLEAGKKRLVGDTSREATSTEVMDLRKENLGLKQLVAETVLENRLLKKSVTASASDKDERCD